MLPAFILAGGLGTRLRAVVSERPKPLGEVNNRPFLDFLLCQLHSAGVRRAVLCTGYLAERVKSYYGSAFGEMEIAYSVEHEPLGTGGAIRLAADRHPDECFLVLNGDSWFGIDIAGFLAEAPDSASAAIALAPVDDVARYGAVRFDDHRRILEFTEKSCDDSADPRAGWINAGIYLLRREHVLELPAGEKSSLERDLFPTLIKRHLHAHPAEAPFIDIGVPETYARAGEFFARQARRSREQRRPKLILLDRDGTLIRNIPYLDDPDRLEFIPGSAEAAARFTRMGIPVALVTNQSGIGRGLLDEGTLGEVHARLVKLLDDYGARLDGIYHCPDHPSEKHGCRKPNPDMLHRAMEDFGVAPDDTLMIGDSLSDMEAARNAGVRSILVRTEYGAGVELDEERVWNWTVNDLRAAADLIGCWNKRRY